MALNETLKQIDLTDIHRTFHSKAAEYKLFSITCGTFSRTVYMLGYKTSLNKFKKTETVLRIFFYDHNQRKDGGVKGRVPIFSCENTKRTTSC